MFLNIGKRFIFLSLISLWAIFLPTVSAQDIKQRQISFTESPSENPPFEAETRAARILEEMSNAEFSDFPNAFQTNGAAKKSSADENTSTDFTALPIHLTSDFRPANQTAKSLSFEDSLAASKEKSPFRFVPMGAKNLSDDLKRINSDDDTVVVASEKFRWGPAIRQSMMLLAVQHGYALALQPKTRLALKGKFFKDYFDSVKKLNGWDDKNRFFTNYIAHPMQGSLTGYIYVQNKPSEMKLEFAESGDYWRSRLTAMAWSAAWSTQFELGPISQSSIGNVGLSGRQGYVDLVITPTVGTALLITEDAVDRFLIKPIERAGANLYIRSLARMFLNPTRTLANLFRFKEPWYRDRPRAR